MARLFRCTYRLQKRTFRLGLAVRSVLLLTSSSYRQQERAGRDRCPVLPGTSVEPGLKSADA